MNTVNYTFLVSLCIIAFGYLLKRSRVLSEDDGKAASRIIINITLPALVIGVIRKIEIDPALALLPVLCIVYNLAAVGIGYLVFRKNGRDLRGVGLMGVLGFNIGLFAYPLVEGIWGAEGLKHIAMLDLGNAFVIFGLSYIVGFLYAPGRAGAAVSRGRIVKMLLTSIPFMAYILALVLSLTRAPMPRLIDDILSILGRANMFLVLLVLGLFLNFRFDRNQIRTLLKVLGIRYAFGLIMGLALYFLLPFASLYRAMVLICLILPVGMAIIPFSVEFGHDQKLAGSIANLTIVISFFLMWALVGLMGLA